MDSKNDMYRNPPPPLGYVKKQPSLIVKPKHCGERINIHNVVQMILQSKICDEPDFPIYEDFVINPGSENEEVLKIPFATVPKVLEILDTIENNQNEDSLRDTVINSNNEHPSSAKTETSVKDSVLPVENKASRVTETGSHKNFAKLHVSEKNKSYSRRKQKRSNYYDKDDDSQSTDSDNSYSSNRNKCIKKSRSSDSCSRSPLKKSDSNYQSRSQQKKFHDSDSDSRGRSHNTDSDKRQYRKISYMDSFSGRSNKKDTYKESHSDKELNDSNSNVSGKSQKSNFKRDGSEIKPCTSSENNSKQSTIKTEQFLLYGEYRCKICKISTSNETSYWSHMEGKKHKKMLENVQGKEAKKKALLFSEIQGQQPTNHPLLPLPTPASSKYPDPPPGYHRKKLDIPSVIQDHVKGIKKFPLPGLHKLTEIRSANETTYYCSLCDCNCSYNSIIQHLCGFKHQFYSLKYYRSDLYEQWIDKPKYIIKDKLFDALKAEERKFGRGLIKVEEDVRDTVNMESEAANADFKKAHNNPSTSTQSQDYFEYYRSCSIPDPTRPGFYCKVCKCSCITELIWNNHIVGKRHLGNLKKMPGIAPSKCKYIPAESNVRPYLFDIIERENEYKSAIVGLQQIREVRKPDINAVMFNCFLCGACLSSLEILTHILSNKHREKYLNEINHPAMEAFNDCNISELSKCSILEDICAKLEAEEGSGTPEVCYAKSSIKL